jgi:hypothetical protein
MLYHPAADIEWVNLSITAGVPLPVKATATKCRGVIIGKSSSASDVLVGDVAAQTCRLPANGDVYYLPIDDASKIYLDIVAGAAISVGVGIVK